MRGAGLPATQSWQKKSGRSKYHELLEKIFGFLSSNSGRIEKIKSRIGSLDRIEDFASYITTLRVLTDVVPSDPVGIIKDIASTYTKVFSIENHGSEQPSNEQKLAAAKKILSVVTDIVTEAGESVPKKDLHAWLLKLGLNDPETLGKNPVPPSPLPPAGNPASSSAKPPNSPPVPAAQATTDSEGILFLKRRHAVHRELEQSTKELGYSKTYPKRERLENEYTSKSAMLILVLPDALLHSDPDIRDEGLWVLNFYLSNRMAPTRAVVPAMLKLLLSANEKERETLVFNLERIGQDEPHLVDVADLDSTAKSPDPGIAASANKLREVWATAPKEGRKIRFREGGKVVHKDGQWATITRVTDRVQIDGWHSADGKSFEPQDSMQRGWPVFVAESFVKDGDWKLE